MGDENPEGSARVDQPSAKPSEPRNPASDLHVTAGGMISTRNRTCRLTTAMMASDGGGVTRPILGVIVATVVLYFGKDILLPLAMASILAVAFSPIASRLETFVGRFVSAALVVVLAITAIGAIGFFLTVELTSVAVEVAGYSNNIAAKLASLQGSTPAWLQTIEHGVKDVERRLQKTGSGTNRTARPRWCKLRRRRPPCMKFSNPLGQYFQALARAC